MSTSSSFDSSAISQDDDSLFNINDEISGSEPDIVEAKRLTIKQEKEAQLYRRELMQSEKNAKKWTKAQVRTVAAIKDAELEAKRYELDRLQAEFEAELANKEAEVDAEMREIDTECGELRVEIQSLEVELSELKESRKRNLLQVRSEISSQLKKMEQREINHASQIQQLQNVLNALKEKHQRDLEEIQEDAANGDQLLEIEISRVNEGMERARREIFKADEMHSQRMSEVNTTIESLKNEISASHERINNIHSEMGATQTRLIKLQQDLEKAEEQSHIHAEQLAYCDEQKTLMKNELTKLDRSLWNSRKTQLLRSD